MKNVILPTYLPNTPRFQFNILGDLSVEIEVKNNPFQLSLEQLFWMAARKNKKRDFLFVSPILGKHIPVPPAQSLLSGMALAHLYAEEIEGQNLKKQMEQIIQGLLDPKQSVTCYETLYRNPIDLHRPTIFIGFAETATALGHSVFQCFGENGRFIHTTRETLLEQKVAIAFEEEHSHAVAQTCYPLDPTFLQNDYPIVLVDDEITTGKTCLNIIESIQQQYPRKEYIILSLLNWRSDDDILRYEEWERRLGITIRSLSLLEGQILVSGKLTLPEESSIEKNIAEVNIRPTIEVIRLEPNLWNLVQFASVNALNEVHHTPYLRETGRFGLLTEEIANVDDTCLKIGSRLKERRKGTRTLCMGTGEFMFIPMRIASHMGEGVVYQSSTRSPIYPCEKAGYGAQNAYVYESPDDPLTKNYFYNIPTEGYDDVFVFMEREIDIHRVEPMLNELTKTGIPYLTLVFCSSYEER